MYAYPDAEVLREYPDGKKLLYLQGREGLKTVGDYQGHCSYYHYYWTEPQYFDPPLEYFFLMTHADGTPGILVQSKLYEWFRKPHPTDGGPDHLKHVTYMRPGFLTSTSYDWEYPAGEAKGYSPQERAAYIQAEIAKFEEMYRRAKKQYSDFKNCAEASYGPLRKEHPCKAELDRYNREVSQAQATLEEQVRILRLFRGRVFKFRDKELILLSTTAKGLDYKASDTRYTDQLDEFMGKDTVFVSDST